MYNTIVEHLKDTSGQKTHYYLLELDAAGMNVSVRGFARDSLPEATTEYLAREKWAKDKTNIQVVLVAAQSLVALRKAYPNYFLDTGKFVELIRKIKTSLESWDDAHSLHDLRKPRRRPRRVNAHE